MGDNEHAKEQEKAQSQQSVASVTPCLADDAEARAINDVQSIISRMARMPQGCIHPDTIPKDVPEDSAFSKVTQHWRFLQKEWQRAHAQVAEESSITFPEPDVDLFHKLSIAIINHIQKQAAIKYAVQDAGFNIIRRGVQVDIKTDQLRRYLEDLEGIRLAEELISLFGLHDYKGEIILREVDRTFGTASSLESEKRKRDTNEDQYKQDMLGLAVETARGVKDMGSALRNLTAAPKSYGRSSVRKQAPDGGEPESES